MTVHVNTNPLQKSPERAFALQKYLLLHSQHDALQKHIQAISTIMPGVEDSDEMISHHSRSHGSSFSSSPPATSSAFRCGSSSTSISPISETSDDFSISTPKRPTMGRPRRSSLPATISSLTNSVDLSEQEHELEEEELKLLNVNQQIKTTLTELLNCDSVKGDQRYARWCQERLMDVEKELRWGRRDSVEKRRGSGCF